MKNFTLVLAFFTLSVALNGQTPVKAVIHLKGGKSIEVFHFGKLTCETNHYALTYTTLRGKYSGNPTEISDYKDISKLVLSGFTEAPVASKGNQKATITVVKKSGATVTLEEAELVMSCYNPTDRYNEIHVQIMNPLTDKVVDMAIEVRNIESVVF